MSKSLTEVAKSILMKEEASNAATLKPGSKSADPAQTLGSAAHVADAPKSPGEGSNVGAAASSPVKKDNSKPTQGAKPAEPAKKIGMAEEMEDEGDLVAEEEINEGDDVQISEELEEFVNSMIEEGASEDEILAAIEENFEVVEETLDEDFDSVVEENYEVDMSEDIEALFAGEELSEEFKAKAKTIFEAAVKAKIAEELVSIEEAYAATLAEEVEKIEEELSTNVDDYLNYVVEQWTAENEVAIEAGLRAELTEDFISGLRNLFAEHYIDIPADKVNVVEELGAKVEELEAKLNEEIDRSVALNKMLNESKTNEILVTACEGLTDTQAEKLKSLAEGIEYATADEYAQKVSILRENYFSTAVKTDKVLDSVEVSEDGKSMIAEELTGPMAKYVATLGKTLPR